jgi:hypothetical protein
MTFACPPVPALPTGRYHLRITVAEARVAQCSGDGQWIDRVCEAVRGLEVPGLGDGDHQAELVVAPDPGERR